MGISTQDKYSENLPFASMEKHSAPLCHTLHFRRADLFRSHQWVLHFSDTRREQAGYYKPEEDFPADIWPIPKHHHELASSLIRCVDTFGWLFPQNSVSRPRGCFFALLICAWRWWGFNVSHILISCFTALLSFSSLICDSLLFFFFSPRILNDAELCFSTLWLFI